MITVQIASVPEREDMLEKTIASLRPQCDRIWVGLNRYKKPPGFLSRGEYGEFDNSMGDAVKFYNIEKLKGYVLTCDDDLIYPPDYVTKMTWAVYNYQCPVSLHGKVYGRPPARFHPPDATYHCLHEVVEDAFVDVGGTGVLCWHTDLVKISFSDFELPNMADLYFARACFRQGVNIVALKHPKDYLGYQNPEETIWQDSTKQKFEKQTKLLKSFL